MSASPAATASQAASPGTAASALADGVDRALSGAGLRAAPRNPAGHPTGPGYAIEPMPLPGPLRVAVRWHHPAEDDPRPRLELCRDALTTAGYRVERFVAPVYYLAVLAPPAGRAATSLS